MSDSKIFLDGAQKELPVDKSTTIRHLILAMLDNKEKQEHVCAYSDTDTLTCKFLNLAARKVAASLASHTIAAICMKPSIEFIITVCGVILSGIPYVPIEPTLPVERIKYIIEDSHASVIISETKLDFEQDSKAVETLLYSQLPETIVSIDSEAVHTEQEDTLCFIYTSGSTGLPKGVRLPHRALLNRLFWQWATFPYKEDEVCCLKTSISYVDSMTELFGPLLDFTPLYILPKALLLQTDQLISTMKLKHITRIILVPSLLTILFDHLKNNELSLSDLRIIISSGETLLMPLVESFFELKERFSSTCQLLNFYGSTEVMGDVTYEIFESIDNLYDQLSFDKRVSIGRPIDNIRVYIVNPDERGVGELIVTGNNIANGYHNIDVSNTKLSSKFFLDDDGHQHFCTGDSGKIWNDRIIYYGRNDTQIKIGGNRVDLSEIELIVKKHFNSHQSVAVHDKMNDQIVLFLQGTEEQADLNRLELAKYLPSYAVPSRIVMLTEFPVLVSGKINRHQLADSVNVVDETKTNNIQVPSNRYEAFCSVLEEIGISRAHMNQTFVAAGGSSLNALAIISKLHRIGFSRLTIEHLFSASTLNGLLLNEVDGGSIESDLFFEHDDEYQVVLLANIDKDKAISIIVEAFSTLGEIDALVHRNEPDLLVEHKREMVAVLDYE